MIAASDCAVLSWNVDWIILPGMRCRPKPLGRVGAGAEPQVRGGGTRQGPPVMGLPNVRTGFDVDPRLLHDAVLDPKQPVVEPPVDGADPLGPPEVEGLLMAGAGQPQLAWQVALLQGVPQLAELVGLETLSSCRPWTMNTGTSMLSMRGM